MSFSPESDGGQNKLQLETALGLQPLDELDTWLIDGLVLGQLGDDNPNTYRDHDQTETGAYIDVLAATMATVHSPHPRTSRIAATRAANLGSLIAEAALGQPTQLVPEALLPLGQHPSREKRAEAYMSELVGFEKASPQVTTVALRYAKFVQGGCGAESQQALLATFMSIHRVRSWHKSIAKLTASSQRP